MSTYASPVSLDRRRHPVRLDLAAASYKGKVEAASFVEGFRRSVRADVLDLRPAAQLEKGIDTQAVYGEAFQVFEETPDGWSWGQLGTDGYVGWVRTSGLADSIAPTHRVRALRTFRYPGADLKFPPLGLISLGAMVSVTGYTVTRGLEYALLSDGSAVVARHLVPVGHFENDWVAVAEELIGTPYLWGGRSSLGLDCSALSQIAASFGGHALPRDSDMQAAEAGDAIPHEDLSGLKRGDLIFWRGHVAIVRSPDSLLHANGYTMTVAVEPLEAAIKRIAATEWGVVTGVRRLG
ncbi:NlpC/P60 family protein [Roseibium litorale]|uniref:C40 family peptidase n=1 Tax=Roseibium litorale TaxID=2803841 RepID=A0ABR9CPH2_9HYPH|nr:NlpC/P60 family protein [Roseibium litorale]MBD8892315.1 C40 family peptidase [Roseibium litorale]